MRRYVCNSTKSLHEHNIQCLQSYWARSLLMSFRAAPSHTKINHIYIAIFCTWAHKIKKKKQIQTRSHFSCYLFFIAFNFHYFLCKSIYQKRESIPPNDVFDKSANKKPCVQVIDIENAACCWEFFFQSLDNLINGYKFVTDFNFSL